LQILNQGSYFPKHKIATYWIFLLFIDNEAILLILFWDGTQWYMLLLFKESLLFMKTEIFLNRLLKFKSQLTVFNSLLNWR
jgi:hypothetical protein